MDYLLLAYGLTDWFWDSWYELRNYSSHLKPRDWMVISAASVAFGFLCLKGHSIRG